MLASSVMTLADHPEISTIEALAGKRAPRHLSAGEILFHRGDSGDTLYGVVSGQVELSWGIDQVEIIEAGSCFGAGALADPNHRRINTATALTETQLLEMNREQFLFAMQELPMFGLEMLHDLELRLQKRGQQGSTHA
jgi:CRP/FNR family cyclic AMP-dependent transcriptional regulator